MAGSYKHIVDDDGNLLDPEAFSGMIENLGDAYEMAEEMYGMIWYLADQRDRMPSPWRIHDIVKQAQANYERGLDIARDENEGGS